MRFRITSALLFLTILNFIRLFGLSLTTARFTSWCSIALGMVILYALSLRLFGPLGGLASLTLLLADPILGTCIHICREEARFLRPLFSFYPSGIGRSLGSLLARISGRMRGIAFFRHTPQWNPADPRAGRDGPRCAPIWCGMESHRGGPLVAYGLLSFGRWPPLG